MRVGFVAGSIAAHAVTLGVLGVTMREPARREAEPIVVEMLEPVAATAEPVTAPAPVAVPSPVVRKRVVRVVTPPPPPAPPPVEAPPAPIELPPPPFEATPALASAPVEQGGLIAVAQAGLWQAGSTRGDAAGRAVFVAPRRPVVEVAVVERVDVDLRRMDASYERLRYLVQSWQHNEYVASCLEKNLGRGGSLLREGGVARARLVGALTRSDRRAAETELAHVRRAATDFDALYLAARRCVDRVED